MGKFMSNNDGNPLLRARTGRTLRVEQGGFPGIETLMLFSKKVSRELSSYFQSMAKRFPWNYNIRSKLSWCFEETPVSDEAPVFHCSRTKVRNRNEV